MPSNPHDGNKYSETQTFLFVLGGTILLGLVAFALSILLGVPIGPQFELNPNDFFIGVIATLPLVVFLWWFSNTTLEHLAVFRRSQIKFFAEIGFTFTPLRIALMALGAGITEELLFRGVVQSWISGFAPVLVAIIASNILFGALHMRTALYALIAGLVGVYLGVLFAFTDNLLAPMVTHALYDAAALEYTRRAVKN
ncbi:type II CAAX endopeptidase family protein [Hyphococcus flavus]|uniref:Type II CAAX endopeptidase family protein n=1 Tax=Hyphococcus flavus TaxID=1866326 RepID=A0AAE9ZB30_9PROT|nr:type II CAAX endopeptidase family protein [Hyphococcus flavus]WDI31189.1 type II CAAX endopeptidase family protein [Hyphococcus flavus]